MAQPKNAKSTVKSTKQQPAGKATPKKKGK